MSHPPFWTMIDSDRGTSEFLWKEPLKNSGIPGLLSTAVTAGEMIEPGQQEVVFGRNWELGSLPFIGNSGACPGTATFLRKMSLSSLCTLSESIVRLVQMLPQG